MPGWEQARNEINQRQANQERHKELAQDVAQRLVRALDPRIRQFVQTLDDHDQWPTRSERVTEKKVIEERKGLLRRKVSRTLPENKTVTMRTGVQIGYGYHLEIKPTKQWGISKDESIDQTSRLHSILFHTPEGVLADAPEGTTRVHDEGKLVKEVRGSSPDSSYFEPAIDVEKLSNELIKGMANYLLHRGLPLPRD